jgi:hypothetical protein
MGKKHINNKILNPTPTNMAHAMCSICKNFNFTLPLCQYTVLPSREASGTLITSMTNEYILFTDTEQGSKNKTTLQSQGPSAFQMFVMAGSAPLQGAFKELIQVASIMHTSDANEHMIMW